MKITSIRIRVLRSRPVGYGHDAAEIEAQLEDGDDPNAVAAELRRRCEAEVRQGAEQSRLLDSLDDLRSAVMREQGRLAGLKSEIDGARDAIRDCAEIAEAAREKGLHLPPALDRLTIPF